MSFWLAPGASLASYLSSSVTSSSLRPLTPPFSFTSAKYDWMPLRIWMPSCAAGPLNTAACPSTILSLLTPCAAAIAGTSASVAIKVLVMFLSSSSVADHQKTLVPRELGHVELLPHLARFVFVFGALPRRRRLRRLARLPRFRIAQAERGVDEQRRADPVTRRDQQQPRLLAERDAVAAEKRREVDHAVQVAAHVRHALDPGPRLRHGRDRRHRDHLPRLLQVDQPAVGARLHGELGRRARGIRGAQPRREIALIVPEGDPLGHLSQRRDLRQQVRRGDRLDDVVAGALLHAPVLLG